MLDYKGGKRNEEVYLSCIVVKCPRPETGGDNNFLAIFF